MVFDWLPAGQKTKPALLAWANSGK